MFSKAAFAEETSREDAKRRFHDGAHLKNFAKTERALYARATSGSFDVLLPNIEDSS
jgi:hypothetical protein